MSLRDTTDDENGRSHRFTQLGMPHPRPLRGALASAAKDLTDTIGNTGEIIRTRGLTFDVANVPVDAGLDRPDERVKYKVRL